MIVPPWKPDLWLNVDAGWRPSRKPNADLTARIQTDPHCLKQHYMASKWWDYDFCMQGAPYIQSDEIWLPYAYDPTIHYPMELEKETDICMIGLQYGHREQLANRMRSQGYNVDYRIGVVFDEYREAYNRSRVAVSFSSLQDTPARAYEAMGMGVPLVANRTPDLMRMFDEGEHFLGFETIQEAEAQIKFLLQNEKEAEKMAAKALSVVSEKHTYDKRIQFLLETVGLV
jgi:glycosyltransferase involved in cell wall biosynthesis